MSDINRHLVIERGEVDSIKRLEGFRPISVITFKTGEKAIFKATDDRFEVVVSAIDAITQFNLVPPVSVRKIEGSEGIIQYIPEDSELALHFYNWKELIPTGELIKAAVFDFILDSRARTSADFLINRNDKKIFLVNNDRLMLLDYKRKEKSVLIAAATEKGPVNIPDPILLGFQKVIDSEEKLKQGLNEQESAFVGEFVNRAKLLIKNKILPVQ